MQDIGTTTTMNFTYVTVCIFSKRAINVQEAYTDLPILISFVTFVVFTINNIFCFSVYHKNTTEKFMFYSLIQVVTLWKIKYKKQFYNK